MNAYFFYVLQEETEHAYASLFKGRCVSFVVVPENPSMQDGIDA